MTNSAFLAIPAFFMACSLCCAVFTGIMRRRRQVLDPYDIESQPYYSSVADLIVRPEDLNNSNNESTEAYVTWVQMLSKVKRKPNCLTAFELDMIFPAQKLKDAKIVSPKNSESNLAANSTTVNNEITTKNKENVTTNTTKTSVEDSKNVTTTVTSPQQQKTISSQSSITVNSLNSISPKDEDSKQKVLAEKDITEVPINSETADEPKLDKDVFQISFYTATTDMEQEKLLPATTEHCTEVDVICSICQTVIGKEDVEEDWELDQVPRNEEVKVRILPCNHCFHDKCISPWILEKRANYPLCKRSLINEVTMDILQIELENDHEQIPHQLSNDNLSRNN